MITVSDVAQIIGIVSLLIFFCINFFIILHPNLWRKSGKIAALWITIYVFFLVAIRFINLLDLASLAELRIISGFSSSLPLIAVVSHLFLAKNVEINDLEITNEYQRKGVRAMDKIQDMYEVIKKIDKKIAKGGVK